MDDLLLRANAAIARGDPFDPALRAELDALFAELRPVVVRVCQRKLRDDRRGEEVAHEALAVAWRRLGDYEARGTFVSWVCGIARKLCQNHLKKLDELLSPDGELDPASEELDALRGLCAQEREQVLEEARGRLPRVEQDVLRLASLGLAYADIDEELGLSGSGARNELAKARRRLPAVLRTVLAERGHGSSFFWTTVP